MNTFWLKITLMPTVIALVTLISRKYGNLIGGVIAGMPWVGGAILLFIALEQGKEFAFNSISGVMVGLMAWLIFCTIYVILGQRLKAFTSLFLALILCLISGAIFSPIIQFFSTKTLFLILIISVIISLKYFPKIKKDSLINIKPIKFELGLRMLMITVFVFILTYSAEKLGPTWSGILTPFPVITAVLAVFTHLGQGMHQVRIILIGMYTGVIGFATFLLSLHFALPIMGLGLAFFLSLLINVFAALLSKKIFSHFNLF